MSKRHGQPKLTEDDKRAINRRQAKRLHQMLDEVLNNGIAAGQDGLFAVGGLISGGIIKTRKVIIDAADHADYMQYSDSQGCETPEEQS